MGGTVTMNFTITPGDWVKLDNGRWSQVRSVSISNSITVFSPENIHGLNREFIDIEEEPDRIVKLLSDVEMQEKLSEIGV